MGELVTFTKSSSGEPTFSGDNVRLAGNAPGSGITEVLDRSVAGSSSTETVKRPAPVAR
jgi:hypothetical protein